MFDGYSIGSAKLAVKYSRTMNNNNGTNNGGGDNYGRKTLIDSTDWDKEDQELAAASKQKSQNGDQTESAMGRSRGRGQMVNNSSNISEVSYGSRKSFYINRLNRVI